LRITGPVARRQSNFKLRQTIKQKRINKILFKTVKTADKTHVFITHQSNVCGAFQLRQTASSSSSSNTHKCLIRETNFVFSIFNFVVFVVVFVVAVVAVVVVGFLQLKLDE